MLKGFHDWILWKQKSHLLNWYPWQESVWIKELYEQSTSPVNSRGSSFPNFLSLSLFFSPQRKRGIWKPTTWKSVYFLSIRWVSHLWPFPVELSVPHHCLPLLKQQQIYGPSEFSSRDPTSWPALTQGEMPGAVWDQYPTRDLGSGVWRLYLTSWKRASMATSWGKNGSIFPQFPCCILASIYDNMYSPVSGI